MQQNLIDLQNLKITYLVGSSNQLHTVQSVKPLRPFCAQTKQFLELVSRQILSNREAKAYSDVITFAFWIRKASIEDLERRFQDENKSVWRVGRGVAFHIAPSNVPVNYAYSLVAGLLCGNVNIVRVPSKQFPQIDIINQTIIQVLKMCPEMAPYILLVRYGHDKGVNDFLSAMADMRIIWGGDETVEELRKSALKPRAMEITFADRYSIAVIDADAYLTMNTTQVAKDFYNDTYLTDQNACTSPRLVAWIGTQVEEAKRRFWDALYQQVKERYQIQGIQAVDKLVSSCLLAISQENTECLAVDNRLLRMQIHQASGDLMQWKGNSGYFFEIECRDITELFALCNNTRCQTISYIGPEAAFQKLLEMNPKGIDRIVPVGKTMDFDLLWDGYNLYEEMTRTISIL